MAVINPDPKEHWQRTSPIAVVFFILRFLRRLVTDGLPALAPMVAVFAASEGVMRDWALVGAVVLVLAGVVGSVLAYLRFRFRVEDDEILVRSGVLHQEQVNVDFNRVQNVAIREPFYMRPFGLALLAIDTAGSGKKEITLSGIKKPIAQALRANILAGAATESPGEAEIDAAEAKVDPEVDSASGPESRLLLVRGRRDIVIYGLTINFMLWAAIVLGVLFGSQETTEPFFAWIADKFSIEDLLLGLDGKTAAILGSLVLFAVVLLILAVFPLISVIGALFQYHDYRLTVDGETYRRHSGLLSRHDESLKRHKIQSLVWKQNFVGRWFGRINMNLKLTSPGEAVQGGQLPVGPKSSFMVPALHRHEAEQLSAEFFPDCQARDVQFSSINRRRYVVKTVGMNCALPISAALAAPVILVSPWFLLLWLFVLGFAALIVNQLWYRMGYGLVGDYGFVRGGFIGTQITIFPLYKVQRVDLRQTPGQRRAGLANLTLHLASNTLIIPYMKHEDAERIRDLCLYRIESSNLAWY